MTMTDIDFDLDDRYSLDTPNLTEPEDEPEAEEDRRHVTGDVLLARWVAFICVVLGLPVLVLTQGRWGIALLGTAAFALVIERVFVWANRRELGIR